MDADGTPKQETLDKLAAYFGEPAPVVQEARVLEPGTEISQPTSALEWLGLARVSIDRVEALLRAKEEAEASPVAHAIRARDESAKALEKTMGTGRARRPPRQAPPGEDSA
jgi:hypothetical protein